MKTFLMLCLLLGGTAAIAAEPRPQQFAHGFPVIAPGPAALYRITLPKAVYRSALRGDLGDLRVFNADDEALPHQLRHPVAAEQEAETVALAFFPIGSLEPAVAEKGLRIAIDAGGAIIEAPSPAPAGEDLAGYIVDGGEKHADLQELEIQWAAAEQGFVDRPLLASSSDLHNWRDAGSVTLADLSHGGQQLRQDRVLLSLPADRYQRLAWPAGQRARELVAINGRLRRGTEPLMRQWTAVAGRPAKDGAFEFDSEAHYPVDRLRMALPQQNSVVRVRWLSRNDPAATWRALGSELQYRLEAEGTTLRGGEFPVATDTDRYWRVEIIDGDAASLGSQPRLELGWVAHELLFVARGGAPFQLAVGSAQVGAPRSPVDALLAGFDSDTQASMSMEARLGKRRELGGDAALVPPAEPVPWQRYLLWAILIAAVALLARMALGLFRQMNGGDDKQHP